MQVCMAEKEAEALSIHTNAVYISDPALVVTHLYVYLNLCTFPSLELSTSSTQLALQCPHLCCGPILKLRQGQPSF